MKTDFHLHSDFSGDSKTPMVEMIERGILLGLDTMCFTEHFDQDFPSEFGDFSLDICSYYERLSTLKDTYASKIEILFGVELGMQKHLGSYYETYVKQFPFDYVIASQHLVNRIDPYYPVYWKNISAHTGVTQYFEELLDNLKEMKDYDSLGHLDYIVRYVPQNERDYSYEAYAEYIDPILEYLIAQDKCLEVNTAGLKYGLGHPNPEESVLKRYRELGGEKITIGSDAHVPEHLAYDFPLLKEILLNLGFHFYCVFRNRKAEYRKLDD